MRIILSDPNIEVVLFYDRKGGPECLGPIIDGEYVTIDLTSQDQILLVLLDTQGWQNRPFPVTLSIEEIPLQEANDVCERAELVHHSLPLTGNSSRQFFGAIKDQLCVPPGIGSVMFYRYIGRGLTEIRTCSPITQFNAQVSAFLGSCLNRTCISVGLDVYPGKCTFGMRGLVTLPELSDSELFVAISGITEEERGVYSLSISHVSTANDRCQRGKTILTVYGQLNGQLVCLASDNSACFGQGEVHLFGPELDPSFTTLYIAVQAVNSFATQSYSTFYWYSAYYENGQAFAERFSLFAEEFDPAEIGRAHV